MRISCRLSAYRPHKPTLPLDGCEERSARTEARPASACQLHARVRPQSRDHFHWQAVPIPWGRWRQRNSSPAQRTPRSPQSHKRVYYIVGRAPQMAAVSEGGLYCRAELRSE